ncbi:MAG: MFS transporter [Planctomycetes bacterium]|nr:MFS transporter [Planctomycetota bacterium]
MPTSAVPPDPAPPGARPRRTTRNDLRAITWDGAAFCVMVGAGQNYLQAFALALGHTDVVGGLIATLPMVGGAFLQLAAPWAVVHLGSQKRWVILTSIVQALCWLPLALGAWTGSLGVVPLFAIATLYWAVGLGAGPAWTSWVETIVPAALRERFFGRRQAVCQAAVFVALIAAGELLDAAHTGGWTLRAFAVLFIVSCLARLVSVGVLTTQSEPVPLPDDVRHVGLGELVRRIPREPGLRQLFCIVPLQFAVQMAEPFLAPYSLRKLHLGYRDYLVLVAAAFLGRIIALPIAGRMAKRHGSGRLLWISALGLCPVAMLWTAFDHPAWIAVVQLAAGFAWGALELGNFLAFFEAVPHRERTSVITAFFFANALAAALGSVVGGELLATFGADQGGYVALFAVSTVLRLGATLVVTASARPPRAPVPA